MNAALSWSDPRLLEAVGLYMTRTSALVMAAPIFGQALHISGARVGLIAVLSLTAFAATGTDTASALDTIGPLGLAAMALREVAIGLALAFVLQGVLVAVRMSGELIGQEMGFNMASVVSPTGPDSPLVTQLYEGLFLLGLFAIDGHQLFVRALCDSFQRAPVGQITLASGMGEAAAGLISQMFAAGVTFAAPVMVVMALVSILIGLLARAVPQLNVLEVGFTLRIAVALVAMFAFAPLLAPAMERLYATMATQLDDVLGMIGS